MSGPITSLLRLGRAVAVSPERLKELGMIFKRMVPHDRLFGCSEKI
jgi:hypothetical protein